ncbi:MAG: SUMF1/EgtB/PvdO family nonheme iron enzyme [Myxococcales bacterium]|nr:SUMF1/EgtB/PvdO family nonheme iron enzyme [Myxococcales bacterium]
MEPAAGSAPAPAVALPPTAPPAPSASDGGAGGDPGVGACPADMAFVDVEHCPEVERTCLKKETGGPNHLVICHEFALGTRCTSAPRRERFCIDRYEYPNQKGAHPPVHVNAYDAAALCAARGKRLCWESEWTAACEGPEHLPFPYGLERSSAACNIDNPWIAPDLDKAYDPDPRVSDPELRRIDQSVPSGSKPGCRSGFGVYDQPGNMDEWVRTEERRGLGGWAGLKGGAWGHVRNACRPATTSHVPQFRYYFISFRCCRDADPARLPAAPPSPPPGASVPVGAPLWRPPAFPVPGHPAPRETGWTPR